MNARIHRFVEWIVGALCVAAASAPAAPPLSMTGQDKAILRGRFVLPDGAPAGGVRLELKELDAVESALATATSGADGAFSMEYAVSKKWSTLEARREGSGTLQWYCNTSNAGSVVDLGIVRLPPGGALEGIVLDESGAAALGEWEVSVYCAAKAPRGTYTRLRTKTDPTTGRFHCEGVPIGPAFLTLSNSTFHNWIDGPIVPIEAQETQHVELIATKGLHPSAREAAQRIVVDIDLDDRIFFEDPRADSIVLIDSLSGKIHKPQFDFERDRATFDDLAAGTFDLEVRDERYAAWRKSGVHPGDRVEVPLRGSAAVALKVLRADSRTAITDYRLRLCYDAGGFWPRDFTLRDEGDPLPESGIYRGLAARSCVLLVMADGFPEARVEIDGLEPFETREVEVPLSPGAMLCGQVFAGDVPISGATVELLRPALPHRKGEFTSERGDREDRIVATRISESNGAYHFGPLAPGLFEIECKLNPAIRSRTQSVVITDHDAAVAIELPPISRLLGQILAPEGASFAGLKVFARVDSEASYFHGGYREPDPPCCEIDAAGRFSLGPLPPGSIPIELELAPVVAFSGFDVFFVSRVYPTINADPISLGTVTIEPGKDAQVAFDLRDRMPGTLRVTATIDGKPASYATVTLRTGEESSEWRPTAGSELDFDGTGVIGPTRPCEGFLRLVVPGDTFIPVDTKVRVVPGRETPVTIDVRRFACEIAVLDASDGKPLKDHYLTIRYSKLAVKWLRTDANGIVNVALGRGTYTLRDNGPVGASVRSNGPPTELAWPPENASRIEIRVERAEKP